MPETAPTKTKRINVLEAYRLRTQAHLTYQQIADLQGITRSAVHQGLSRFLEQLPSDDQLRSFEESKADLLSAASQTLLASCLDPEVVAKAGLRDRVVSFGILFDKHRLQTAQSTSNISVLAKIISQADGQLFSKQSAQADEQATANIRETEGASE